MIHVITMWHNEEYLAPLFLNHYKRADKITVILDTNSDNTPKWLREDKITVERFTSAGLDDLQKAKFLSAVASMSDADVRIVVDSDEFIYPVTEDEIEEGKVYSVGFYEVFRHLQDKEIDRTQPPLQQRTHGNPQRGQSFGQDHFVKPIVFGKGVDVYLAPGNHYLLGDDFEIVDDHFDGSHWAMADPAIAMNRRLKKRLRMSQENYARGLTSHDWNITGDQILDDCQKMLQSPVVINTERERF